MKTALGRSLTAGLFFLPSVTPGHSQTLKSERSRFAGLSAVAKEAGKTAVIVVGSAGKAVWAVTKFGTKRVAWRITSPDPSGHPPGCGSCDIEV